MGLDGVELVIEVEEHFGITIANKEASEISTVGDLLALIESRCEKRIQGSCVSLTAFLRVRRFIREFLAVPDLRLRPSISIASIVPCSRRREMWKQLRLLYGTAAPELRRPTLVRYFLLATVCSIYAAALFTLFIDSSITVAGLVAATVITFFVYFATKPL